VPTYHRRQLVALRQALDEAKFGAERTLNLRASLPSAEEATRRLESWLRERQASGVEEVLVITGRGQGSPGGVGVVKTAVVRHLALLKRRSVVREVEEHTPGSFVVRLASLRAMVEAPKRRRDRAAAPPPAADPPELVALAAETRERLRELARLALESLGVRDPASFLGEEMRVQFGALAPGVPEGPDREGRLRAAIDRAIDAYLER
jgi:hypothetical protein